jgi:hypothetical protein
VNLFEIALVGVYWLFVFLVLAAILYAGRSPGTRSFGALRAGIAVTTALVLTGMFPLFMQANKNWSDESAARWVEEREQVKREQEQARRKRLTPFCKAYADTKASPRNFERWEASFRFCLDYPESAGAPESLR